MRIENRENLKMLTMVDFALYFTMRQQQTLVALSATPEHKQVKFLEKTMTNN